MKSSQFLATWNYFRAAFKAQNFLDLIHTRAMNESINIKLTFKIFVYCLAAQVATWTFHPSYNVSKNKFKWCPSKGTERQREMVSSS